ncbi:MAG: hypothetical protein K0Q67_2668 [Cellvibrio sp.]|nr:hypothetical protein [Cellvibrio sp.]
MNRRNVLALVAASTGSLVLGALTNIRHFNSDLFQKNNTSMLIVSAGSMFDLTKALTENYKNSKVNFTVKSGNSLGAIIAVKHGAIDLAGIARDLSDEEDDGKMSNYLIARSSVAIVVNHANLVNNLTKQQVRRLFTGDIKNWRSVGGADAPVNVISRMNNSSTRQYFEEVVLNGRDCVGSAHEFKTAVLLSEAVAKDPNAIGFIAAKDAKGITNVKKN